VWTAGVLTPRCGAGGGGGVQTQERGRTGVSVGEDGVYLKVVSWNVGEIEGIIDAREGDLPAHGGCSDPRDNGLRVVLPCRLTREE
jgi:hypothetical protein